MMVIVGLGNPGSEYQKTRHNIGFQIVERLVESLAGQVPWEAHKKSHSLIWKHGRELVCVLPQTFMNASGVSVKQILNFFNEHPEEKNGQFEYPTLFVVHDDLDIELGKYKLVFGSGPKIHNGLLSIHQQLKTEKFWYVRVGVDGRQGDRSIPGSAYVLQQFGPAERPTLEAVKNQVVQELLQAYRRYATH